VNATLLDSTLAPARTPGERALAHFLASGFRRIEPAVLHPAATFLEMSGEEIRGRLFQTVSPTTGEELCLRPEYTIPVCRAYLASDRAGGVAEYSYLGPVFRAGPEGGGERGQTGLESFGRRDAEAADAEIFALALEAAAEAGGALVARIGDAGLFDALLAALALPDLWRRRLRRGLAQGRALAAILDARFKGPLAQAGVLAAMESADHDGARALVEDLLAIAGIDAVGGRSASEIADRFLEQAALRSQDEIGAERRQALETWLAVSGDPDVAALKLRELAGAANLDLGAALDAFERRNGFIAARGVKIEETRFSAAFVRDFDYYTGFVFEAHDPARADGRAALAGGRYDGLARKLGAGADIPAVGAAITLDRLPAGAGR
jgi:ATP phosphoribosyltransferase regulatory subunit